MAAPDGDAGGQKLQEHAAGGEVVGDLRDGPEGEGMVRDHEIGLLADRLDHHIARERKAGHNAADPWAAAADEQPHCVPVCRQPQGRDALQSQGHI